VQLGVEVTLKVMSAPRYCFGLRISTILNTARQIKWDMMHTEGIKGFNIMAEISLD
jgi:hypothetical protein